MKGNSILLTASMLLLTPMVLAYGSDNGEDRTASPISIGAEVRAQKLNVGWHTKGTSTDGHLDMLTTSFANASAFTYQESNDNLLNYSFGARLTAKSTVFEDFSLMLALGFESGMKEAKGYRPLDAGVSSGASITQANWNLLDSTGVSTWESNLVMAPALFIGYRSMALGIEYDMREFEVSGHETALTTYLDKTIKDNQVLFGFRGEELYELEKVTLSTSFEFMTNFGGKSDEDAEAYFKNLAKYGTDTLLDTGVAVLATGQLSDTQSTYALPSTRAVVSSVRTNITKASVGFGVLFSNF